MNDLFRALFGIPPSDNQNEGVKVGPNTPNDSNSGNNRGNRGNEGSGSHFPYDDNDEEEDDDEIRMHPGRGVGFFGFPLFNDPFDFHKQFDKLVEEMHKSFGMFGFGGGPSISWEDGSGEISSTFFNEPPVKKTESLRDAYLKQPDCGCDTNISVGKDINARLTIDNLEPGPSNNSAVQYSGPKVYSKSVFIQSIRKPDGTVETIKKVRDHTGNEETTITQTNPNDPLLPSGNEPDLPNNDTPGLSLLRKFFNF